MLETDSSISFGKILMDMVLLVSVIEFTRYLSRTGQLGRVPESPQAQAPKRHMIRRKYDRSRVTTCLENSRGMTARVSTVVEYRGGSANQTDVLTKETKTKDAQDTMTYASTTDR